ncbi:MAG: hypothetical protein KME31_12530 [Tolypothrix carrinoi HA7290-LM1]|jgi:hypothetical protein|nr:hypothetical protein [Tolypothrix carrinoi HA7290-LM1]
MPSTVNRIFRLYRVALIDEKWLRAKFNNNFQTQLHNLTIILAQCQERHASDKKRHSRAAIAAAFHAERT